MILGSADSKWSAEPLSGKAKRRNGKVASFLRADDKLAPVDTVGLYRVKVVLKLRADGAPRTIYAVAMKMLKTEFGDKFSQVFKTITVDNGSEFADFAQIEQWGTDVFFVHPYTSWERPQNERHNGLFRTFVSKGASLENYSAEYILSAADELNGRPRKKLGYRTPEELFEAFLDSVFAA